MTGVVDTATFQDVSTTPAVALIGYLAMINLVLLVFNLIPAFPLDGGRIARAVAWKVTGDRSRGTRFSARLGELFSWLMIGLGIFVFIRGDIVSGLWFGMLGWFLGSAARGAVAGSRYAEALEGVTAGRRHGRAAGDDPGADDRHRGPRPLLRPLPRAVVRGHRRARPLRGRSSRRRRWTPRSPRAARP